MTQWLEPPFISGAAFIALLGIVVTGCGDGEVASTGASGGGGEAGGHGEGSTSRTGPSTGEGGSGTCSAMLGIECPEGSYCDYPDDWCGGLDGSGVCKVVEGECPTVDEPTCGCGGEVYSNACAARAAGVDVSAWEQCTPPDGTFACGWSFCLLDEYCREVSSDTGETTTFSCAPLPAACDPATPDCACITTDPCATECGGDDEGRLTVTCLGG